MAQIKEAKESFDQILAAEKAVDDRRISRNSGYGMARNQRDPGTALMSNGVRMVWHVPKPILPSDSGPDAIYHYPEGVGIPEGMFVLKIGGRNIMFDAEEFRKYLRWA